MFKNYLKIAYRNLIKNKENSFIHIFGLTTGLTGCLLIGLFVLDELKYDTVHPNGERTYRIYTDRGGQDGGAVWASTSPAFSPTLKADFPEVENTLRIFRIRSKQLFKKDEKSFLEEKGIFAEASIFDLFQLPFLHGDSETALQEINSIVLTKNIAEKYFGATNPVGQNILVNNKERKITGVLEKLPAHFHLDFNFLVSFENLLALTSEERMNSWVWQDFYNYIQLYPATNVERFEAKFPAFVEKYAHPQTKESGFYYYPHLQKLEDIYLNSTDFRNDMALHGNYQYVVGLSIVGAFLLFIACINFINLTTARAVRRSKEVGVRKAAGAYRSQLAIQFISEALLIVVISMLLAAQLTNFIVPYLNDFTSKALVFDWFKSPVIIGLMLGITVLTSLLAGAYPAFVLSGFRPADALKGSRFRPGGHVKWLRKGLVTLQFTLSILLIISVLIIFQQVNFLGNKELGFNKEQLLYFPMKKGLYKDFESTKTEFLKVPGITSASTCFGIPGDIVSGDNVIIPGADRKSLSARIFTVDHEYIETMGMEIIAGRDFSKDLPTDATENFIINETAVTTLGIANSPEEAIGKPLEWEGWDKENTLKKGKIIGVVKDFHYNSLHESVQSSVLHIYPDAYWKLALRVDTKDLSQTIAGIEKTWDSYQTGYPLDYQFVDEEFGAMYQSEEKLSSLLWIFTLLAIIISSIGAFGLAAYAAERRRKEIGIRKVLGATTNGIIALLSKDFLKLVVLALLIASPIAWYFMNGWLEGFAYRVDIQVWVFLVAGLVAITVAFLTVGFNGLKAALANPIKSLRSE